MDLGITGSLKCSGFHINTQHVSTSLCCKGVNGMLCVFVCRRACSFSSFNVTNFQVVDISLMSLRPINFLTRKTYISP